MRWHAAPAALVLVSCLSACGSTAGGVASQSRVVGNLSGIETIPPGPTPSEPGLSRCRGVSRYRTSLSGILTDADLATDVSCVAADFDSNGSLDFAIWGGLDPSRRGLRGTRSFVVLFFDAQRLARTETLRHEDYDHAVLWPRGQVSDGACQVSPPTVDGIILPGEGAGSWYYVYNREAGRLKAEFACDQ